MNTTTNEIAVLKSVAANHFGGPGEWVWSNCINESGAPSKLEGKALSGTVSSLCQKGLLEQDGNTGREACVRITEAGIAALK